MKNDLIIQALERNATIFQSLLGGVSETFYNWKPQPDKWSLLEIVCHLHDEECEDFRARVRHVLERPKDPMPPIDPVGWVTKRRYLEQDYEERVEKFLKERAASIAWLRSLENPQWDNVYQHATFGAMTAAFFLANWLAHDYLHFRQINRLRYAYLKEVLTEEALDYAGNW